MFVPANPTVNPGLSVPLRTVGDGVKLGAPESEHLALAR
jgi:hypothetical protein